MNTEKFKKDMASFGFRQHQDVLTYLDHLETKGWTIKDAKEWVEGEKKKLTIGRAIPVLVKQCPLCQTPMGLLSLNFNRATVTGEDSQSVWFCRNEKCMNTIYNKETVAELQAAKKGGT